MNLDFSNIPPTITHSYYAETKKLDDGTVVVTGWFDIASDSNLANYPLATRPDLAALTPISADDWHRQYSQRLRTPWQIKDGKLAPYTPPNVVIPLKERASTALQQARMFIYDNYGILGDPTPEAWVTYLRSLMAIASGADTTSVSLPIPPSDKTA